MRRTVLWAIVLIFGCTDNSVVDGGMGPDAQSIDVFEDAQVPPDSSDAGADATTDVSADALSADALSADALSADAGTVPYQGGTDITTTDGEVEGEEEGTLRVFKGIPFAAPPVGERRLRATEPAAPYDGTLRADEFGPACPQSLSGNTDEDCLTLNVWGHLDDRPRPVMVWIYGGGFVTGDSGLALYDGADLARDADVVVVSINYRLGVLGGLALPELQAEDARGAAGNMGLLDQIQALRWLASNLRAFGGDPGNVTVFGESAGAISTCALMGAPDADTLFHKAIMQSGNCVTMSSLDAGALGTEEGALAVGERFMERLGCDDAADRLACLRALPVDDFVDVLGVADLLGGLLSADLTGPVVDGVVLPELPYDRIARGDAPPRPLIIGSNGNEGRLFTATQVILTRAAFRRTISELVGEETAAQIVALYSFIEFPLAKDAFDAFLGELLFNCNSYHTAEAAGAYSYYLMIGPGALNTPYGPLHTADIFYVFGNFTSSGIVPSLFDLDISERLQVAWGSFARTGEPSVSGGWPVAEGATPEYLRIGLTTTRESEFRRGRCDSIRELGLLP
ncbi:MAG: para-nitrobenzyl esterase [Polyangiales bacterium]|jgi:para-nitrobenzyl esterase